MRKAIYIFMALVLCAGISFAATATLTTKGIVRTTRSGDYRVTSYSSSQLIITNTRNDTVVVQRGDTYPFFDFNCPVTLYGAFYTNNAGADSGDITIKLEIAWDSTAFYVPIIDSVGAQQIALVTDTLTNGAIGKWIDYNKTHYNTTINDSTLTYPLYTIQPKHASGGYKLALPLIWPKYGNWPYIFSGFRLILSKGTKFKSGDTTWVNNGALEIMEYIK